MLIVVVDDASEKSEPIVARTELFGVVSVTVTVKGPHI